MAGRYDFTIKQGSTFSMGIDWKHGEEPVDLTGYTARMQIRYDNHSGSVAVDLTTENGGIEIDSVTNKILIYISAEQTSKIQAKECVYDLEMVDGYFVERIIEGKVRISPEVTK